MIYKSYMQSIGKEIMKIARKNGISLYRMAKDLTIDYASLYRSLSNNGNPEWKRIEQVLDYLDYYIVLKPKRKEVKRGKSKLAAVTSKRR